MGIVLGFSLGVGFMLVVLGLCAVRHSSLLGQRMEELTAPGNDETEGGCTGSTACAATPPSASPVRGPAVEAGAPAPHDRLSP
jgi:hypothetical protein